MLDPPVAGAAARALPSAFSANVSPSSGGSSTLVGQRHRPRAARAAARANSRRLCSLCVASSSLTRPLIQTGAACDRLLLAPRAAARSRRRERQQLVEVRARERRALGRRLHLDQAAVAGHHDVRVDLGGRVLGVVEVEQRALPSTIPQETAATEPVSGERSSSPSPRSRAHASASAT